MAKIIVPLLILAATVVIAIVVFGGSSCPSNAYCPSGGGPVSTDNQHYNPPDTDVQHEDFHPEFAP